MVTRTSVENILVWHLIMARHSSTAPPLPLTKPKVLRDGGLGLTKPRLYKTFEPGINKTNLPTYLLLLSYMIPCAFQAIASRVEERMFIVNEDYSM